MARRRAVQAENSEVDSGSSKHGAPTHYVLDFDDNGRPTAVCGENYPAERLDGALPEGWDDMNWTWQPAGDPAGAWVEMEDSRRAEMMAQVEAEAKVAAVAATVTVTVFGQAVEFPTDDDFIEHLRRRLKRFELPDPPALIKIRRGSEGPIELDKRKVGRVLAAVLDARAAIEDGVETRRAEILGPSRKALTVLKQEIEEGRVAFTGDRR